MLNSMMSMSHAASDRYGILNVFEARSGAREMYQRSRRVGRVGAILGYWCCIVVLGGCEVTPDGAGAASETPFSVGENLVEEPCRAVPVAPYPGIPGIQGAFQIFCGEWESESAEVASLATDLAPTEWAEKSPWRDRLNQRLACKPARPTRILDGVDAVALDCAFQDGGWPLQALVARIGHQIYLAQSIPAALPAAERAIGVMTGRQSRALATQSGTHSEEIAQMEAKLAGGLYTAGDLESFRELLRLAQHYNYSELYAEAEQRYRDALALQRKVSADNSDAQAFLLMSLALQLSNQERFEQAEALYDRAEGHVSQAIDPTMEPRLVSYRAIHHANQRHRGEARELARKATEMRMDLVRQYEIGRQNDFSSGVVAVGEFVTGAGPADSGVSIAALSGDAKTALCDVVQSGYVESVILVRQDEVDRAEDVLGDALRVFDRERNCPPWWLPKMVLLQAEIAEKMGQLVRAEQLLRSGIADQRKLLAGSRTEAFALIALGRVLAAQNKMTEALDAFREGFRIIAEQGGGIRFEDAQPFFEIAFFSEAGRRSADQERLQIDMFQVAQLVKGSVTAQTVALTTARLAASEQEVGQLIRRLQDARRRRDQLDESMTSAQADPSILAPQLDALQDEWNTVQKEIEGLERQVQAAAPRYNQLTDAPVVADDVMAVLGPGEAIAQVLLGPTSSIGLFIDANGIEAYEIDLSAEQAKTIVDELRQPFEATGPLPDFPVEKSHDLYQRLFGPIDDRLAAVEHVVVVPAGPLLSLPAGLLVVEPPAGRQTDYTQVAWLARRQASTLAPSVQSFVNLRKTVQPSRAPKPFIGFGDPIPNRDADAILSARNLSVDCREDILRVAAAPPLPNTATELSAVASSLGASDSSVITGPMFTEENIEALDLAGYKIVYFATHALLPHELTCWSEPLLIASKPSNSSEASDGLLSASEILELKLDADLVVLSACNTGGPGTDTGGESLSGLARAFFYSGARSLLVTHWQIPDKPTVELMIRTFRGVENSSLTLAEALRQSQMALMAKSGSAHPVSWAAFTVVGDGGRQPAAVGGATGPDASVQAASEVLH